MTDFAFLQLVLAKSQSVAACAQFAPGASWLASLAAVTG
jgi:hypothetical protein